MFYRWRHRDLVDRGLKPTRRRKRAASSLRPGPGSATWKREVKIPRKAATAVEAVVRPKDRYRLVAEPHAEGVRTGRACHALGVSRSGYYAWAGRAPSPRAIRQAWLTDLIGTIHQASRGTYGAPGCTPTWSTGTASPSGTTPSACSRAGPGRAGLPTHSRCKRSRKLATVTDLVRRDFRRAGAIPRSAGRHH